MRGSRSGSRCGVGLPSSASWLVLWQAQREKDAFRECPVCGKELQEAATTPKTGDTANLPGNKLRHERYVTSKRQGCPTNTRKNRPAWKHNNIDSTKNQTSTVRRTCLTLHGRTTTPSGANKHQQPGRERMLGETA